MAPSHASQDLKVAAPWGRSLTLITAVSIVILVGIPLIGLFSGPRGEWYWTLSMVVFPLLLLVGASFFMIRGYVLTPRALLVQRLGWTSTIYLAGLQSAVADPEAMAHSMRTFGNGGLFCFAGAFRNKKLGSYRAFATDPQRAVVLTLADRTIVVTPADPERLVAELERFIDQ